MAAEAEFQVVKPRKGRRRQSKQKTSKYCSPTHLGESGNVSERDEKYFIDKIQSCRAEIQISDFGASAQDLFSDTHAPCKSESIEELCCGKQGFSDIVCYGIGKLTDCPTARYQFAFLLLLKDLLQIPGKCFIYEPRFTKDDESLAEHFGCTLIKHNEEGKRKVKQKTLFVMIHCGKPLYNSLLWANWGRDLSNVTLLGNKFSSYQERLPSRQLADEAAYISRILPYTCETPLLNTFYLSDIFNDTALHTFHVQDAPHALWADCPEPKYDVHDPEIITRAARVVERLS